MITGIYYTYNNVQQRLPQLTLKIQASITNLGTRVQIHQRYYFPYDPTNSAREPVECAYALPLDEQSAVVAFEAVINTRKIVGKIEEKKEARRIYNDAIKQQKSAALLEQQEPNLFQVSLGHIIPGQMVEVTITYLTELALLNPYTSKFVLPLTIAPKYTPMILPTGVTFTENDLQSQVSIHTSSNSTTKFQALTFTADIHEIYAITEVVSYTHSIHVTRNENGLNRATVSFGCETPELTSHFEMLITSNALPNARATLEFHPAQNTCAVQIAIPHTVIGEQQQQQVKCELIFILDRSGSMEGSSIEAVRNAMQVLLRSLPTDCHFNIIGFGSTCNPLWKTSKQYNESNFKEALKYAENMNADLGGTEIFEPLNFALTKPMQENYPRQIFLLTDGQVSGVNALTNLVKSHAHNCRVFTFGVGSSVDRHLCQSLATAGNGAVEYISTNNQNNMDEALIKQLKRALQPAVYNVQVNWGKLQSPQLIQCPNKIPSLFPNAFGRSLVYALDCQCPPNWMNGNDNPSESEASEEMLQIKISYRTSDCPDEKSVTLFIPKQVIKGDTIHALAARERIRELECASSDTSTTTEIVNKTITQLGMKYGLTSRCTSFVAVDPMSSVVLPTMECATMEGQSCNSLYSQIRYSSCKRKVSRASATRSRCAAARVESEEENEDEDGATMDLFSSNSLSGSVSALPQKKSAPGFGGMMHSIANMFAAKPSSARPPPPAAPMAMAMAAPLCASSTPLALSKKMESSKREKKVTDGSSNRDIYHQLVQLQTFAGSWPASSKFFNIIQPRSALDANNCEKIAKSYSTTSEIIATLMAIVILQSLYADKEAQWKLLVLKAQNFVKSQFSDESAVQSLSSELEKYINSA